MEEVVICKFVYEDSSYIIFFCVVVEVCVLYGFWWWVVGFLCSNKIVVFFMKVGKSFLLVEDLSCKV